MPDSWRCANTKLDAKPCNLIMFGANPPPMAICPRCKKKPTWVPEDDPNKYNKPILAVGPDPAQAARDRADIASRRRALQPRMNTDLVAVEVQQIIAVNQDLKHDPKVLLNFQLFLFLYYASKELAQQLKESESLRQALEHEFKTGEVLEMQYLMSAPMVIEMFLAQGWSMFKEKWAQLSTPREKTKLIRDVFVSDKGYGKTARILETWVRPKAVDLVTLLQNWLSEGRNDSIFTGVAIVADERGKFRRLHPQRIADDLFAKVGASSTVGQQIKRWYDQESKESKIYMWGLVLKKIHDALDLDLKSATHMGELHDYCREHVQDMKTAFAKLISPQEIDHFFSPVRFPEVYKQLLGNN